MNLKLKTVLLTLLAVVTVSSVQAQIAVLSAQQQAAYERQLPETTKATLPAAFKNYLQGLQRASAEKADWRQDVANAIRVAESMQGKSVAANAGVVHFSVEALSDLMRLPNAFPEDGILGGEVEIVAAQDEYEGGSFLLYAFQDMPKVELKFSDLKSANGDTFSKENLDLKVVKVWYQNANGWFSYFQDVGLQLVPELLVHDENLIRVDTTEQANYARVSEGGKNREVWISAPRKMDVPFDPYTPGFADAKTLQPVALQAGRFKQFVLTAHVAAGTRTGTYRGVIEAGTIRIPVALKVLPFQLPLPKTNTDIDKNFMVSLMGAWPRISATHPAFLPTLKNMRQHNLLHLGPGVNWATPQTQADLQVRLMKEAGLETRPLLGPGVPGNGMSSAPPLTFDEQMSARRNFRKLREFYVQNFGHSEAYLQYGDEQGPAWIMRSRPMFRLLTEEGLKSDLAGHDHNFLKAGHMLDFHPAAGSPSEKEKAATWNAVGHARVAFYANQHNGSENPSFVRRQHGLLSYLSNYDTVDNYEFAYGPWNDRGTELYKPMVLAYPTSEGLVDTLEWEGFREGIDDIRYATKLRQLANEAIASDNLDRVYAGRKVRQWFAVLDGERMDQNTTRLEMIEKIQQLMQLAGDKN